MPFELSFVKSGYQTATRKYTFKGGSSQQVTVYLRKAEKRKSLFKRLFGR